MKSGDVDCISPTSSVTWSKFVRVLDERRSACTWSRDRNQEPCPVPPELQVDVQFDHETLIEIPEAGPGEGDGSRRARPPGLGRSQDRSAIVERRPAPAWPTNSSIDWFTPKRSITSSNAC